MKKFIGFAFLLLLLGGECRAQMRLGLDEALKLALSENPTIRIAEMEVERYDYVKRQTWGNLLPQLSMGGQINHTFIKQNMSKGFSLGSDQYTTISTTLDATIPLFAPTVYRTLKMNRVEMENAVEQARATRIGLVAEVKKAFYNILLAEESLEVLIKSQKTTQETVDDTELKFKNGLASEYDLLTARVQLSNLRPTIIQTKNSIQVAKRLLKMYLSIPEEIDIQVEGRLDEMRDAVMMGTDNLALDLSQNSELKTLELQEELMTRQLKVANASRLPSIGLFGNFTISGNNMGSIEFPSMNVIRDGYYWQNPLFAGVKMTIPLFAGLTKMNKSKELKNRIQQISLQRKYAEDRVTVELKSSLNDLMTARETMFAEEQTVSQAEKAYRISDTRYRAGAGTILELNTAQLSETQARLNFSQAIYNYLAAKAEYDRIIGREDWDK